MSSEPTRPATASTASDPTCCDECGGRLDTDSKEASCRDCGLVVEQPTLAPSSTQYEHTGAPLTATRHDRGLSTELWQTGDARGNQLSPRGRLRVHRMQRQHRRGHWRSTAESNLGRGCGEVSRLCGCLDLSRPVREEAATLFRTAQGAGLLLGRTVEAMAAAVVYATCRLRGVTRTREEVVSVAECGRSLLDACYRALQREFALDTPPSTYRPRLTRLLSDLDVPDSVARRAQALGRRAEDAGLTNGRRPTGIAAGCVYLAAREGGVRLTQEEIAKAAGTSAMTLRERYKELTAADSVSLKECGGDREVPVHQ